MIFNLAEWKHTVTGDVTYSGACTRRAITVDGTQYGLYEITGSGILRLVDKSLSGVDIWGCGAGAQGLTTEKGGGGGYFTQVGNQTLSSGNYSVIIGTQRGTTYIKNGDTIILSANSATDENGASGGGGGTSSTSLTPGGSGGGVSTVPFGDTVNFTSYPCAGGGGTSSRRKDDSGTIAVWYSAKGGDGGSNGSDGGSGATFSKENNVYTSIGGATGGGNGTNFSTSGAAVKAATYYGSGGGAGNSIHSGGAGYQGVIFMRVPLTSFSKTGNSVICQPFVGTALTVSALSWTPYQPGSGDPTPSNIRPFSEKNEIIVTRLEDSTTKTWALSQTVAAGEINGAGSGTETWKIVTLDGTSVYFTAGVTEGGKTYYNVSGFSLDNSMGNGTANYISSHFPAGTFNGNSKSRKLYTSSEAIGSYFSNVTQLNQYLTQQYNAGTPVQVAYKLASANSFTATGGGSFTAIDGTNTLTSEGVRLTVSGVKL